MHARPLGLCRQAGAEPGVRDRRLVVDVRGQQRVVVLGEEVDQPAGERGVAGAVRREGRAAGAEPAGRSHRDDRRGQLLGDALQHAFVARAAAIDLVDEDERRDTQPLQRAHQHPRLRLDALDRGDDQHGAVEHAQHALDLGDEVRMAGRVEQVDRDVVDGERGDRGLDRDAALPFQRQGIGLGAAVVDAADLVDDTGRVEQPLGEAGLTGVYVGQYSQVQGLHCASCPPRGSGWWGWT
jgi:hypothetical protein